jgi:phage FluMu protein Com
MASLDLDRKPSGTLTVDLCGACQAIWFDTFESAQLTPGATLDLFRTIHTAQPESPRALSPPLPCPRCETLLALTHDLQHATRLMYYRCRYGHGRFTPFFQFLREKNFIRPLDPGELARLKASVRTIRCASCGAPVNIERSTVCGYCQAPIVALDPDAVEKAIHELDAAERQRVTPDPDRIGDSIVALARLERQMDDARRRDGAEVAGIDLVGIGLSALGAFLKWR